MYFFLGLSLGWFSSFQFRQVFGGGLILAQNYNSVGRVSGSRRKPSIKAGQRYPSYAALVVFDSILIMNLVMPKIIFISVVYSFLLILQILFKFQSIV